MSTAASPAEGAHLAQAFGGVVVSCSTTPGPASHDRHGNRFVFLPAPRDSSVYALDLEALDTDMPAEVAARLQARTRTEAFHRWTELEVRAKLSGVPVLALLRGTARTCPKVAIERADTDEYWIAVGRRL